MKRIRKDSIIVEDVKVRERSTYGGKYKIKRIDLPVDIPEGEYDIVLIPS